MFQLVGEAEGTGEDQGSHSSYSDVTVQTTACFKHSVQISGEKISA